jgi:hypothetical protein
MIFPPASVSRPAIGPTQPPVQWVPGVLSPRIKRPGRDVDHSPPYIAEILNEQELYITFLSCASIGVLWDCFKKRGWDRNIKTNLYYYYYYYYYYY